MQIPKYLRLPIIFLAFYATQSWYIQANQSDQSDETLESLDISSAEHRAYLPVQAASAVSSESANTEIVTQASLSNRTKNFCKCKVYKLFSSVSYTPLNETDGIPMIRITASGAKFDLAHNCADLSRTDCTSHGVGIEVGYSPAQLVADPTLTQPDSIVIENGIMGNWDIAIMIHAGVRNVTIRNMVFTDNTLPIVMMGENDATGNLETPVCSIQLENVTILGPCEAQKACLQWIRSKLSDGADFGNGAAPNNYGYSQGEVMPNACDPITTSGGTLDAAEVYAGIYGHGVEDVRLKNVNVSNIGFDGDLPGAEITAAYGIWFRNSKSVYMEDVASIKNKSAIAAVGLYLENVQIASVKNGKFTNNEVTQRTAAQASRANCPEGLWAAGVVSKDSSIQSFCDVMVSENVGVDNVWGYRTIMSTVLDDIGGLEGAIRPDIDLYVDNTESLKFENVYADGLRADRVYGFDFGDVYRRAVDNPSGGPLVSSALPAGAVEKLTMKNVTVCSAQGKGQEATVAQEFKGIFLGDQSSGICIDGARIETNNVAASATGTNSGIEFGAESTAYVSAGSGALLSATGQAEGTIDSAYFNNMKINNNTGGGNTGANPEDSFVGIRAVSTGNEGANTGGQNIFCDIQIKNSFINSNQFDGLRAVDDSGDARPITLDTLLIDTVTFNNSIAGYGFNADILNNSVIKNSQFNKNITRGFAAGTITGLTVEKSEFNDTTNATGVTPVYGFDASTAASCISFEDVKFNGTTGTDADAAGMHILAGQTVALKDVQANCNSSGASTGNHLFTRGLYFETSVSNINLENVEASNNSSSTGSVYGIEAANAQSIDANCVQANNNTAEGNTGTNDIPAIAVGIYFSDSVTSDSQGCYLKKLQACGNSGAFRAYGILMEDPVGITLDGVDGSSNVSDATGQVNSLPVLSQAAGLKLVGGSSVQILNLQASANRQTETTAANLSQSLVIGAAATDSEANINTTANIAHHFPVANRSGAYGVLAEGTDNLIIDGGNASKNLGVRAFGIHVRDASNLSFQNLDTFDNHGEGDVWFDADPFNGFDPTAVAIPAAQNAVLFGGITETNVNLKNTYEQLLQQLALYNEGNLNSDECAETTSTAGCVSSFYNLMWATIAQYRRFCTGVGVGLYNCSFSLFDNVRAVGNSSECDSAGGIVIYGIGEAHVISGSVTSNNEAWKVSERGGAGSFDIDGNIDVSKWQPLYVFLNVGFFDSEDTGATPDEYVLAAFPASITSTEIAAKPTALTQPDTATSNTWTLNARKLTVGLPTAAVPNPQEAINLYDFVSAGPVGVGILLECQRDNHVSTNNTYGNKGHAGLGIGILSDAASSTLYIDNRASGNSADIAGYAWGLADITMSTPNIWYKNWMYGNRVDTFLNSSYLIIFDATLGLGQELPVTTIFPGSLLSLSGATSLDNIVVEFGSDRQASDCVGDLVTAKWISETLVS